MHYLDELIERYKSGELDDSSICDNITRMTKRDEFIQDVNYNRTAEKLNVKYEFLRVSKSPEDIILEWERAEKIIHFLLWLKTALTDKEWEMFSLRFFQKRSYDYIAKYYGTTKKSCYERYKTIRNKTRNIIHFYDEQFESLKEYLQND